MRPARLARAAFLHPGPRTMPPDHSPEEHAAWPWQPTTDRAQAARSLARLASWLTGNSLMAAAAAGTGLLLPLGGRSALLAATVLLVLAAVPSALLYSKLWHRALHPDQQAPRKDPDSLHILVATPLLNVLWLPLGLPLLALALRRSLRLIGRPDRAAALAALLGPFLGLGPLLPLTALIIDPSRGMTALLVLAAVLALLAPLYFGLCSHAAIAGLASAQGPVPLGPGPGRAWSLATGLATLTAAMALILGLPLGLYETGPSQADLERLGRAHQQTAMAACDIAFTWDLLEHRDFSCSHALNFLEPLAGGYSLEIADADSGACSVTVSHPDLAEPLAALWSAPEAETDPDAAPLPGPPQDNATQSLPAPDSATP